MTIRAGLPPMPPAGATPAESTPVVACRVARARAAAAARWASLSVTTNDVPAEALHASPRGYAITDVGLPHGLLDYGVVSAAEATHMRLA